MRPLRALLVVTAVHLGAGIALAQSPSRTKVSLSHTGTDAVGQRLAYVIREELSRSARYEQEPTYRDGLLRVDLVTIDPTVEKRGNQTVAAVCYSMVNLAAYDPKDPHTWMRIYLTSEVVIDASNSAEEQAKADRGVDR